MWLPTHGQRFALVVVQVPGTDLRCGPPPGRLLWLAGVVSTRFEEHLIRK